MGSETGGRGTETSGVEPPDEDSSSASSFIATSDLSVTLLCISSCDERSVEACRADGLGRHLFLGRSEETAGLFATEPCVCLAGLGSVVLDPAAMVNGIIKGAGPFDSSVLSPPGAMVVIVRKVI